MPMYLRISANERLISLTSLTRHDLCSEWSLRSSRYRSTVEWDDQHECWLHPCAIFPVLRRKPMVVLDVRRTSPYLCKWQRGYSVAKRVLVLCLYYSIWKATACHQIREDKVELSVRIRIGSLWSLDLLVGRCFQLVYQSWIDCRRRQKFARELGSDREDWRRTLNNINCKRNESKNFHPFHIQIVSFNER